MDARIKTLRDDGAKLFQEKLPFNQLCQEIAENFLPMRADFTTPHYLGKELASNLTTSYPLLAQRDLGNSLSAMLRPAGEEWAHLTTRRKDQQDNDAKKWLEWASALQRNAMYDKDSGFVRATKEGDHDFAAFGQCVISSEYDANENSLLYRCWHLRDVAWREGYNGRVSDVHRKWSPYVCNLNKIFKGNISPEAKRALEKDRYTKIPTRHVVLPAGEYESPIGKKWNTKYVSVFFEEDTGFVNEEKGIHTRYYTLPRWVTIPGSQYAYSPSTIAALPDARLIQQMTLILLEAGEKAVDPPMVMRDGIIRDDANFFSGGITWVDLESDERIQDAIQILTNDKSGIPLGMEMRNDAKAMIAQAFFLDKLNLPPAGKDMTAYEVSQRIQEFIRATLPLFEPMEAEYNGELCDDTFELLRRNGAFGSTDDWPQSLSGQDLKFTFDSPLHEADGKKKGQIFQESSALLANAAALDPSVVHILDIKTAVRDTLGGIGTPAKWLFSEEQVAEYDFEAKQQQQAAQTIALMQQGGDAAKAIGDGGMALNGVQQGATA